MWQNIWNLQWNLGTSLLLRGAGLPPLYLEISQLLLFYQGRMNQLPQVTGKVSEGATFKLDFSGYLGVHNGENVLEDCL